MRFGTILTGGEPREQVDLARGAEVSGWDGVFTWDGIHVGDEIETFDPWVLMAAMAMATERLRLGAIISPLSRRRPWKVARETMTLDRLSNGRLILPVGLGALDDSGFGRVGEETSRRVRAERLDETLEILEGLWSGEPFGYRGRHYRFEPMAFRPTPVQRPRIPIWVVAAWPRPRSMRRALRYDGLLAHAIDAGGSAAEVTPAVIAEICAWVDERRRDERPFDIVVEGTTPADDPAAAAASVVQWAEAGATWWLESDWSTFDPRAMRRRIEAGPPVARLSDPPERRRTPATIAADG